MFPMANKLLKPCRVEALQSFKIVSRDMNRKRHKKTVIPSLQCSFDICAILSHNFLSSWFINNSLKKINKYPPHEINSAHEALVLQPAPQFHPGLVGQAQLPTMLHKYDTLKTQRQCRTQKNGKKF